MTKAKKFNNYLLEKCLIGNGIINGILNAIIFYTLEKGTPDKIFHTQDVVMDFAFTGFLLGFLLPLIVFPLTQKDITSGKFTLPEGTNKIANLLPNKKILSALVIGVIAMVLMVSIAFVCVSLLGLTPLTVKAMGIFKGIMCAIAGATAGYLTITKTAYSEVK